MTLLTIENLSKTFSTATGPVQALSDVSLTVEAGECLAIVGESGSGKTTLANCILGIIRQSEGSLYLDGKPLPAQRKPEHRRAIQLVQQNPLSSLNPRRTIGASIRLGLDTNGIGEKSMRWTRVEEALQAVGLPAAMRTRSPASLSGGQRQRVGIARALVCEPRLVVLDEPTSALDVLVQARVLRLLNDLRTVHKLTYVFITHDLAVVRNVADRVAVFRRGRLIEQGLTETLFTRPEADYTRSLIASVPVVDAEELALRDSLSNNHD